MTFKRLRIATAAAVIALMVVTCAVLVVLFAVLTAAPESVVGNARASASDQDVVSGPAASFAVFKTGLPAGDRLEQSRLRSAFAGTPGSIANVDFDLARPAAIKGSPARAWIAPTQDKVCLFVPDPVDGYGATCASSQDIASGKAIAILGGGSGADSGVLVAALVPDGGAAPNIDAGGGGEPLAVSSNVAAAVVPASAELHTTDGTIDLNFPRASSARACAVGADCSGK